MFQYLGVKPLPEDAQQEFNTAKLKLSEIYNKAIVCLKEGDESSCVPINPNLTMIMRDSTDFEERAHVWKVCMNHAFHEKYVNGD